jgi:MATE family multidrug resistance protein
VTTAGSLRASARRIAVLAWPVLVGQLAVLAFSTVDTLLIARYSALDLAALAVGSAAYITVFIGSMGVVLAVGPIAGQLFGADRLRDSGRQLHQAMWLALLLSVVGCALLVFPQPFLAISRAEPAVAAKVRAYLGALAFALPSALLFTAFRGFNTAVSRPKIVMLLQVGALALKVPLSALLVHGAALPAPFAALSVPSLGAAGCGIATAIAMNLQMLAAWQLLRRDPFYARFEFTRGLAAPHRASLAALLRLGVPMGASIMIEVTGFTFLALFISRLGAVPVAGHQVAANLVALMFMVPLAIGNAAGTLVAQRIGAGDAADARRLAWDSLLVGCGVAALLGALVYMLRGVIVALYTHDAVIAAAALPLLAWVVLFHIADAAQTVAAFVLRAYRIATVPLVIYALAIWGVGLGGGYALVFETSAVPDALRGARGFWAAATAGLVLAAGGMAVYLGWMLRRQRRLAFISVPPGRSEGTERPLGGQRTK